MPTQFCTPCLNASCPGLDIQWPVCSQFIKSLLWNTGIPGKYSNDCSQDRNHHPLCIYLGQDKTLKLSVYILHIFFLTSFNIYSRHFLKTKNSESTLSFYIYLQISSQWSNSANTYNPIDSALCVKRILVILSAACS